MAETKNVLVSAFTVTKQGEYFAAVSGIHTCPYHMGNQTGCSLSAYR